MSEGSNRSFSYIRVILRLLSPLSIKSQDHVIHVVADPVIRKIFWTQLPFDLVDDFDDLSSVGEEVLLEAEELLQRRFFCSHSQVLIEIGLHWISITD